MSDARQRLRLWRALDRQKMAYRINLKPVFMRAFDKQIQPLYDKISQVSDIRDIVIPPLNNKVIEEAYMKLYMTTAVDFAKYKRIEWRRKKKSFMKQDEDEIFEGMMYQEIINYLKIYRGATIKAAGDTSVELIQKMIEKMIPEILDQGIGAGEAQTMLRDMIQSAWHEAKYYRTERIVVTEVNRAANWGSLEGTKSLGVEMNKIWLCSFNNSRPEHMDADGQAVDSEEPFVVGGENLDYPGDPNGSPGQTINCHCSTYETLKD